jgi:hypothetical protein
MAILEKKPKAIFQTEDRQLIPLDDIQHINARYNDAIKDEHQTLTILYKDGMKVTIPASEYDNLYKCWEARKNGRF